MKSIGRLHRTVRLVLSSILFILFVAPSFSQTGDQGPVDITFQSMGHSIKGRFFASRGKERNTTVILLNGFPGNPVDVLGLGDKLAHAGINALTFSYTGTYESEGIAGIDYVFTDIAAAYEFLHQPFVVDRFKIDTANIILGGWCFGGGLSLAYTANHPEIKRIFSIAGNDHGQFARDYLNNREFAEMADTMFDRMKAPRGPVNFEGKGVLKRLADNPTPYDLRIAAPRLATRDILLIGGWDDAQVTIDNYLLPFYRALKQAGAKKIRFVAFQTDHYFLNVRDELASELIQWIQSDVSDTVQQNERK